MIKPSVLAPCMVMPLLFQTISGMLPYMMHNGGRFCRRMPKMLMRVRLRRGMRLRRRFFAWKMVGSCFPAHRKHPAELPFRW